MDQQATARRLSWRGGLSARLLGLTALFVMFALRKFKMDLEP